MKDPAVSILIFALNQRIEVVPFIAQFRKTYPSSQILVVDNSSTRALVEEATQAGAEVILEPRRGKAQAMISALPYIRGDVLVCLDPDRFLDITAIAALLEAHKSTRADMILGVTAIRDGNRQDDVHDPLSSLALKLAFKQPLNAIFSGIRLLSKPFYKNAPILSRGLELELELAIQALDKGFRILEVEVPSECKSSKDEHSPERRSIWQVPRVWLTVFRDYKPLYLFGGCLCTSGYLRKSST